jgi:hypothetical protein
MDSNNMEQTKASIKNVQKNIEMFLTGEALPLSALPNLGKLELEALRELKDAADTGLMIMSVRFSDLAVAMDTGDPELIEAANNKCIIATTESRTTSYPYKAEYNRLKRTSGNQTTFKSIVRDIFNNFKQ